MTQFKIHPAAEQELIEAREWYDERSELAGQAFALEVDHAIRTILEAPLRWPRAGVEVSTALCSIGFRTRFCIGSERTNCS
jgi:plasmid stabilization system protein ParE